MIEAIRPPAILLFLGSAGLLAGAYGFQFLGGLQPCVLCLYQRVPHAAVLVLTLGAIVLVARNARAATAALALSGVALLVGAGIAGFHAGVEQHWWAGTAECGSTTAATSVAELRAQLLAQPIARCDEVAWSLFGISMAGYNLVVSFGMAVFAAISAGRAWRLGENA